MSEEPEPAHVTSGYRFAPIPEALLYDPEITPTAVRLYGALARHGMDPEHCYPSHARLAGLVGISERSVARPLRELEDAGWIARVDRGRTAAGEHRPPGFHVRIAAQENATQRAPERATSAQESAPPARAGARLKKASEREPVNEGANAPSRRAQEGALPLDGISPAEPPSPPDPMAGFDEFWQEYPRRDDKASARRAWEAAIRSAGAPAPIIAGARRYAADPNREAAFTKYPGTWLRAEAWANGPLPPRERPPAEKPRRATAVDTARDAPSGRMNL